MAVDWGNMAFAITDTFTSFTDYDTFAHTLAQVTKTGNVSTALMSCRFQEAGREEFTKTLVISHDDETGKISLGWQTFSSRQGDIGSLETFPSGEFVMKIRRPGMSMVENSIEWNTAHSTQFLGTVRCSGCCMSKFKSGSHESSRKRASNIVEEWTLPWTDHCKKKKKHSKCHIIADVLICQNSRCGKYLFLYYDTPEKGSCRAIVNFYTMPVPCVSVPQRTLEREKLISSLDWLPRPISELVVDLSLDSAPGCFKAPPPGQVAPSAERVIDKTIRLTYEFLPNRQDGRENYILRRTMRLP